MNQCAAVSHIDESRPLRIAAAQSLFSPAQASAPCATVRG